jgi:hypothetical protein
MVYGYQNLFNILQTCFCENFRRSTKRQQEYRISHDLRIKAFNPDAR